MRGSNRYGKIMKEVKQMFDVAVIGAGVVGGAVARELTRYGARVIILERCADVAMGATRANSAIVHAGFDAKEGTLKALLNVRGSLMMADYAAQLGVKYKNNGSLVVGFSDEDRATLEELCERGVRNGVPGVRVLDRAEILELEPNIGDGVTCALHAPTGAIICPYELCMAEIGNAMDNGAELKLDFEVSSIVREDGAYTVSSANESVRARYVVNCAGVYSDKVAALAGDTSFTVIPRRGEYMLLDKECGSLVSHTIFRCPSKMGKGILVSPTVDGNLLLGPTAENIEDKEDRSTTAAGLARVRAQAGEQVRGILFGKTITSFTGLRSVGSTGDFIINERDGFVNCAGVESPGLSSAPAIGEYVRELLAAAGLELSLRDDFVPTRRPMHYFKEASDEQKNAIIAENPAFAHIICRCELVSEGEIVEAIHTNPKPRDVDAVKRRTRSGMGRCQGGFCSPYVVEILARELGIDYLDVTKCGGESFINIGKTKEEI